MSTQIQVSPKSGITIGTTPITSGVAGRVLFEGAGNVMQEDSSLFWDNTNKRLGIGATPAINVRLDIRAQGLLSTDIALRVRNSADTRDIININGDSSIGIGTPIISPSSGFVFKQIAGGSEIKGYDGWNGQSMSFNTYLGVFTARSDLRIGSESGNGYLGLITTTSQNRFLKLIDGFGNEYLSLGGNGYDGGGGISLTLKTTTTNNSNFVTFSRSNNTNPFVISDQAFTGIGTATPQARLDIRAQGALSTDIGLRIRNSSDTLDIFSVNGNRSATIYNPSSSPSEDIFVIRGGNGAIRTRADGGNGMVIMYSEYSGYGKMWEAGDAWALNGVGGYSGYFTAYNSFESNPSLSLAVVGSSYLSHASSNFVLGAKTVGTSGTGVFSIKSGTAPASSPVDQIQLYSADIVAGNAAPHFRTEDGSVIKLYKQDLSTNPTNAELATFLSNLGLANLI